MEDDGAYHSAKGQRRKEIPRSLWDDRSGSLKIGSDDGNTFPVVGSTLPTPFKDEDQNDDEDAEPRLSFRRHRLPRSFLRIHQRQEYFLQAAFFMRHLPQLLDCAIGDEFTPIDDADPVGHFFGDAQLMSGKKNCHAALRAIPQDLFHDSRVAWI